MPARRFERIALDLMLGGCAVMFGACVLIEHAQAQPGYVPPPTPLPPPILNPSNPGTVPQPSYQPITPTTPSTAPSTPSAVPSREVRSPATEEAPSTTARSERTSVATTRSVHRRHRGRSTVAIYSCGYLGFAPIRGRFRVNITAAIAIRMATPRRPFGGPAIMIMHPVIRGVGVQRDWVKVKNPKAPAVRREAEED
jgi:hypothetical protein